MTNLCIARVTRIARTVSLAATAALALACTAQTEGSPEAAESAAQDVAASDGTSYIHLVSKNTKGQYTVEAVNGGTMRCANGSYAKTCIADTLVLPADCNWECTDGFLSFQGEPMVRGKLADVVDAKTHKHVWTLTVAAGFDTMVKGFGTSPTYHVTASSTTCTKDPCPGAMRAQKVNGTSTTTITSVDFSKASDPNYVLDPALGYAKITMDEGLQVTGTIDHGALRVDRVFRLWTPKPACDPELAAQAYYLIGDAYTATYEFLTVAEAERFTDPNGMTNRWLVRTAETTKKVTFTGGVNDLWAETFTVDKKTCAVAVTGEH